MGGFKRFGELYPSEKGLRIKRFKGFKVKRGLNQIKEKMLSSFMFIKEKIKSIKMIA